MNVIVVGGWSFSKEDVEHLLREIKEKGLTKKICKFHFYSAHDVLENSSDIEILINKGQCVLFGWSMGGYLLWPYQKKKTVVGSLFASIGESFIKSEMNPYGTLEDEVDKMITGLNQKALIILKQFQRNCGLPKEVHTSIVCEKDVDVLIKGLEYLKKTRLCRIEKSSLQNTYLLHGYKDKILDWRSSLMLATKVEGYTRFIETPHDIFSKGGLIIKQVLVELIGENMES